jgi:hypothetical protein
MGLWQLLLMDLQAVTCNRRNKIGAEQLGFVPLVEGKGCDLNLSVCILM